MPIYEYEPCEGKCKVCKIASWQQARICVVSAF
jgi:hypothetical protein